MSKSVHLYSLLCVLVLFCGQALAMTKTRTYKTLEFEVPLDHFSFASNKTFKIRYLLNDTYWDKQDGPIFFYTGNEGSIELFAEYSGFVWEIAPEFNALVVFAEHRYYGESLPFGNKSFSSPQYTGYLTSSQALADYVDLIYYLQGDEKRNNPIIAFGGSYGGMLAAYIRMKYPHLITGAIAASAPILQFQGLVPCDSFYRVATSDFNAEGKSCDSNILKSWATIRNITGNTEGKAWFSKEWKLCKELKAENDIKALIDFLSSLYTTLAMVNYPYESSFMAPLPAYPVREFCRHINNNTLTGKPLLQALFSAVNIYTNYTGTTKCLNTGDSTYNPDLGDEGWDFQACSEMVMPMCTTGKYDMFEAAPFNEKEFSESCKKKWGVSPQYSLAQKEYGGKNIETASNIVFSNGLLDPWASGGILKNYSENTYAILIPEGAHHLDLMSSNINDPFSAKFARNFHKITIKKWIKSQKKHL